MGRKSSVKELPKDILNQVNHMLANEDLTIDQVVDFLVEAGHEKSRSAVGRYKKNINEVAGKLRQSREMTEALVKEIGPNATEGKTGRLLVEVLQKLVFDHLLSQVEKDDDSGTPKDFMMLAKALSEMSRAQKTDTDRELKLREKAAQETREAAAKSIDGVAKEAGLSPETVNSIKANILGIKLDP